MHGTSIVATCCQFSSARAFKVDAYCDKLATVVGQTKLAVFATVDVRPTNPVSLSHSVSTCVYIAMRVRQRVARVHLRQLILVTTEPCVSRIHWNRQAGTILLLVCCDFRTI